MPAFLIVEDEPQTSEWLERTLRPEFPDARIDAAEYLMDAIELARQVGDRGDYYDVAFLDVRLPLKATESRMVGTHPLYRKQLLDALTYRTVVVNHSAYPSDSEVQEVVAQLAGPNAATPFLVDASPGQEWGKEIIHHARRVVYGRRIAERLDPMLQGSYGDSPRLTAAARGRSSAGGTQELAALIRDIKVSWNDLDDELRRRIRTAFDVREVDSNVLVNL